MPVIFVTGFAQKNSPAKSSGPLPISPCCGVIAVRPGAPCCGVVTVRNNATGRTFEFTVDNSIAKNYTTGTALNAQPSAGIIKSVNGTVSKYVISEPPPPSGPCCGIISIEPLELCCGLVSAKLSNGVRFSFSVPKSIAATLEIGQKVSIQHFGPIDAAPVDGDKAAPVDGYAVIQSNVGALLERKWATYSFPILKPQTAPNNNSNNNQPGGYDTKNNTAYKHEVSDSLFNDKQWEIKQNLTAKGATGRIFINLPKDAECTITISEPATERQVYFTVNDRSFSLVPGTFNIQIAGSMVKNVPVQKGMDTRIKAGVLNVVASGTWTLYDEKKDRQVYFYTTPRKIGLPIGTYQLEINGTMQQVVIKDGETVDF